MEARICRTGLAVILLQRHPDHRLRWSPVASWGRCLDALEQLDSRVLLELKALREGAPSTLCHLFYCAYLFCQHLFPTCTFVLLRSLGIISWLAPR